MSERLCLDTAMNTIELALWLDNVEASINLTPGL